MIQNILVIVKKVWNYLRDQSNAIVTYIILLYRRFCAMYSQVQMAVLRYKVSLVVRKRTLGTHLLTDINLRQRLKQRYTLKHLYCIVTININTNNLNLTNKLL